MKVSELMAKLNQEQALHGDIEVCSYWENAEQERSISAVVYYPTANEIHIEA